MSTKIKPDLPGGFRDFLPKDMIARQNILTTVKNVFERFGFDPLETSIIQKKEVVTKGEDAFKMNIFKTGIVSGDQQNNYGEDLVLRPELTIGLARLSAKEKIIKPFKVYQTGYVFRGERPQAGRFRGFTQFDADIIGSNSPLSDAEIITIIYEVMSRLVGTEFVIKISNRRILNALADLIGISSEFERQQIFRILDKQDKIGWSAVKKELTTKTGLVEKNINLIKEFLSLSSSQSSVEEVLNELKKMFASVPLGLAGVADLEAVANLLLINKLPTKNWQINLSTIRGLGYYTGTVFETFLNKLITIGSVFAGGRYDNLVNKFSTAKMSAVGASVGIDRLFVALEKLNKIKKQNTVTQVLIACLDKKFFSDYLLLAQKLRAENICTQIYLGDDLSFKAQLAYALNLNIPFILIMGEDEKKQNVVSLKNLKTREQVLIPLSKLSAYFNKIL
ncbi:MAG TPA: histidine--tRNA ligase [bacterium]|nr:histidine--tRNA ligase [bacterium]HPL95254.1 histidine--tRNA ligase [bacterium]